MRSRLIVPVSILTSTVCLAASMAQSPPAASASPTGAAIPATHKRVAPLSPNELLKLLPNSPNQWQLKQSTAKNFFMEWASSQALREFNYTPPSMPDAIAPPVHILRFTITDTGYYAGLMGDLLSSQPPKSGESESLNLNGYPARRIMVSKVQERLRVLIKSRYVIQIDVQDEPPGNAQKWFGLLDLNKFVALPVDGDETLPRPFSIVRIDEINPQNNSASKANFTTQEEADRTNKGH